MKIKKYLSICLFVLCFISFATLIIVIFTGCSNENLQINNYNINILFDDNNKSLKCNQTIIYVNNTDTTLNFICFHLYPNAFREDSASPPVSLANQFKAYPNGISYGYVTINQVKINNIKSENNNSFENLNPTYNEVTSLINQKKINNNEFFIGGEDQNILFVILQNSIYPSETVKIEIDFQVKMPNVNHRFGYGNNTVNIANFYPIACVFNNGDFDKSLYHYNGDPFFSDLSNYNISLTIPKEYVVANTGEKTSESGNNVTKTYILEAKNVRDFAIVLSKDFKIVSEKVGDTKINYYYFSDANYSESLNASIKALKFFNKTIGEYPYSTLSVVEANFVHGGMEFPNLVYISNDITDKNLYQQVIVHEIAHQWWYNIVGNSAFSYGWLDEGLTEYSTALFYENHDEYEIKKQNIINNAYSSYSLFVQIYEKVYGEVDTSMNRDLDEYNSEQEYVHMAYVKGMLLFDSLREILGEKKFVKCLQNYFEEYKFKNVTPDNLIASFEKTTKTNLKSYFDA